MYPRVVQDAIRPLRVKNFMARDRQPRVSGWNDLGPQFSVGREHAMEADEMEPWTRDKRGQALHEFQG